MNLEPAANGALPLPFPPPRDTPPPPRLGRHVLALRGARDADLPFLRVLYATLRADEMTLAPWPETIKQAFLADQFRLQHHHLLTYSPRGDFLIVEDGGRAIGRFYLDRGDDGWRVLDIGLLPEQRGRGIGSALLRWTMAWGRRAGAPLVDLHVVRPNIAARRLYRRLGFRLDADADHPTHHHMVWRNGPS